MIRTLILGACLAALVGCSSMKKTVTDGKVDKPADPPKQYEYKDMSNGSRAFRR